MKPDAIIYTSNTGFTAEYAKLLGEKTGLPVFPLNEARADKATSVIYLGWIMASGIKGYKKAAKSFKISAVCAVGMGATGTQLAEVRKANELSDNMPVFTLQGGFDRNKLKGIYKLMINMMAKALTKNLEEKKQRTAEENDMLDLMKNGGNRVSADNLAEVIRWYEEC